MVRAEDVYNKLKHDWERTECNLPSYADEIPVWTKKITDYFYHTGKDIPEVTPYSKYHTGEYLNDLVWSVEKGKGYEDYVGLELALESEWGGSKKEIMEDFYKLIDVKAYLKIMIIGRSEQSSDEIIEIMSKTIQNARMKISEEEYLIIIFPQSSYGTEREGQLFSGWKMDSVGKCQRLQPHYRNIF